MSKNVQGNKHTVTLGRRPVSYTLAHDDRERLKIIVSPQAEITVYAPRKRSREEVEYRLRRRAAWILRQLRFFSNYLPKQEPRQYVSGETFVYLGRQYRLKIVDNCRSSAKLKGRFLVISSTESECSKDIENLVTQWYHTHARQTLERRLENCMAIAERHGIRRPKLRLRSMKRRWGSSNGKDAILLNTELVKAPVHCIDYVIMHELAHLRYDNHSKGFFRLLSCMMPDWQTRKDHLERNADWLTVG